MSPSRNEGTYWTNKVKLFVGLTTKHFAMKTYGGVDVYILIFLISALVGGEWSAPSLNRIMSGERAPPYP
jgi:hypothetical protein